MDKHYHPFQKNDESTVHDPLLCESSNVSLIIYLILDTINQCVWNETHWKPSSRRISAIPILDHRCLDVRCLRYRLRLNDDEIKRPTEEKSMVTQLTDVIIDGALSMATNDVSVVAFLGVILARRLSLTDTLAVTIRIDQ